MRLLVTGDRNWGLVPQDTPKEQMDPMIARAKGERRYMGVILDGILKSPGIDELAHGAAKGADNFAGVWAKEHKVPVKEYPANWDLHGKAAGPIRNQEMFYDFNPDVVVAFHRDFVRSKGTKHMVEHALDRMCMVMIYPSPWGRP